MLTVARPHDLEPLVVLFERAFEAYARCMARPAKDRRPWLRAAIDAEQAVWIEGGVGAAVISRSGSTLMIDTIAIDVPRQGQGYGRRALRAIETHASQTGTTEVTLHTAQQFTRLVAFYSRGGYRVTGVGPHPKGRDDRLRVFFMKSLI